jgi:hypothetical protein
MENRKQETGNGKLIDWPVFHFRFSVSRFSSRKTPPSTGSARADARNPKWTWKAEE